MKLSVIIMLTMCIMSCAYAQEISYTSQIEQLRTESENLKNLLASNTMDYNKYDKWYGAFKPLAETFEKNFSSKYKQNNSFQLAEQSCDNFSLAWMLLKQADYADTQYKEFITTGDVGYAHKWKDEASTKRNDAISKIKQAFELLEQAYSAARSE
ncbi:MAG: hypothetical protein PHV55_01035 [Candidatus Omnitrophica bacterium]|nr:hypothetical protein [Candidatus Omnitrophota bacterium]